jgi:hypothetical protein
MPTAYEIQSDSELEPAATKGTTVYECVAHDYGCASDDTRITGVPHISVTLKPDGGYPFFTHPRHMLRQLP